MSTPSPARSQLEAAGRVTFITDVVRETDAVVAGGRVFVAPERLPDAIGWSLKPQGLCQGDVCVPVRSALSGTGSTASAVDVSAVAAALDRPLVIDADVRLVAMGLDSQGRRSALESLEAPAFSLPDLSGARHELAEWAGQKKLLVAFSSW